MKIFRLLPLLFAAVLASAATPNSANSGKLRLLVVEKATNKPLANCAVRLWVWTGSEPAEPKLKTDAQGVCLVSYPAKVFRLDVGVALEGFVPRFVTWTPEQASFDEEDVPAEYTLHLERGALIGGMILDAAGKPVVGAEISAHFHGSGDASWRERERERNGWLGEVALARTDAQGAWQTTQTPERLANLSLSVAHTNYLSRGWQLPQLGRAEPGDQFTLESLRLNRSVAVLRSGLRVSGLVTDVTGKPVAKAKVWLGVADWAYEGSEVATTDTQGRFVTSPLEEAPLAWLTVAAEGHAPERRQMAITTDPPPVRVQLGVPGIFRGKVVDERGRALAGVRVAVDHHMTAPWDGSTDLFGRFEWRSAPPQTPLEYYFGKSGYLQQRDVSFVADGTEHVITLQTEPVVTGRVTDAATGKPVEKFAVIPGYGSQNWERSGRRWGKAGEYTFRFTEARTPYFLRIEAEGYDAFISEPVSVTNGAVRLDARLYPARQTQPFAGLVLTPAGQPAAGAEVALCALQNRVQVSGPHLDSHEKKFAAVADSAGRFTLPFEADAHTLVAVHASGFAEVPLWPKFGGQPVKLRAWGKVEGKLYLDGVPAPNNDVLLYDDRWSSIRGMWSTAHGTYSQRTDADGRFTINHAPPGNRLLYHVPGIGIPYQHATRVSIEPGKSIVADIGLALGQPQVSGRLVLSDSEMKFDWRGPNASAQMWLQRPPRPETGARPPRTELEERREQARYYLSPAGKAELELGGASQLEFDTQGRFAVRGLRPGTNELSIFLREPAGGSWEFGRVFASHRQTLVLSAAQLAQGHDLGEIRLIVKKQLKPGQPAPDFTAKTLDGGELRLADLRGKLVLLDFWATWCGPCVAEIPNLRAVHETFKGNERFVLLSLSVDEDRGALAKFLAKEKARLARRLVGQMAGHQSPRHLWRGRHSCFLPDRSGWPAHRGRDARQGHQAGCGTRALGRDGEGEIARDFSRRRKPCLVPSAFYLRAASALV